MKFLAGVGHDPGTNDFSFGDDPDHHPDPGVRSPKSRFTGLSIMLAFGGGLHSLSTCSYYYYYLRQTVVKDLFILGRISCKFWPNEKAALGYVWIDVDVDVLPRQVILS